MLGLEELEELPTPERAELVVLGRSTMRCWEWGDPAAPPVVLVHGAHDHGRMFDGFAPRLADAGFRAVAVDALGHGDSSPSTVLGVLQEWSGR
jgi:alpha-beta hydrolase superfamily lysophospholipase